MTIKTGDKLPEATFTTMTSEGPSKMTTADIFNGRKVVLFAVPGAFTPTCHMKHLPGFIARADELKSKGVDTIACVAVNDVFVLDAWAKNTGAGNKVLFLSDGNGDFARAIGMDLDASGFGMGTRSRRYAMVVDNGKVKALNVEPAPGQAVESGVDRIIDQL
jgi:peroxiredoxin